MSDQEFTVHVKRQPQLPMVLAFPLLLVIIGVVVSVFNAASKIPDELIACIAVPVLVWFFYGRRKRLEGRALHGVGITLLAAFLSITTYNVDAWYKKSVRAEVAAAQAKIYADEAPIREARYEATCRDGFSAIKLGHLAVGLDLDYCAKYYTHEQTLDVCRPLIRAHAVPKYGWRTCDALTELNQPNRIR